MNILVTSIVVFLAAWVILFVVSYIFTPFITKYGDRRSRIIYSVIYSLAFAIIVGIGYGVMPVISEQYGFLPTMVAALVFVFILTLIQNYVLNLLFRRGLLKMQRK